MENENVRNVILVTAKVDILIVWCDMWTSTEEIEKSIRPKMTLFKTLFFKDTIKYLRKITEP